MHTTVAGVEDGLECNHLAAAEIRKFIAVNFKIGRVCEVEL